MLAKLLSNLIFLYKNLTTPPDYKILREELEYKIDHDMKYQTEDAFWAEESKDGTAFLTSTTSTRLGETSDTRQYHKTSNM